LIAGNVLGKLTAQSPSIGVGRSSGSLTPTNNLLPLGVHGEARNLKSNEQPLPGIGT
jgi:hypothetical protein